ncbi:MAG: flavodoxin family protein [Candidatus Methanomethylophilaceae archaeon]|nr:flavodoxin family protein [Candidatus Methanomethylophilaceae archaeon]
MKMVAINASPRKGWNTDMLIDKAIEGAESEGAEVEKFDLYKLDKFTGCRSCMACKRIGRAGTCYINDGLKPVLDAIKGSDGIIMGAPNYFGDLCAEFKLLYERLLFPYLTYDPSSMNCNDRRVPVLLIMTSNARDDMYSGMLETYRRNLETFMGPTKVLVSGETLQVEDYSKYTLSMFDPVQRKERREKVFPQELQKAFGLGADMVSGNRSALGTSS